jgi:hypothetical protein
LKDGKEPIKDKIKENMGKLNRLLKLSNPNRKIENLSERSNEIFKIHIELYESENPELSKNDVYTSIKRSVSLR